jgi:peptide/nickel transport system permease protein
MGIWLYFLRRLVQVPLVIFFVSVIIFALMKVTPGDPISIMLGPYATPETTAALKAEFNLDKSLPEQYLLWIWNLLHGDLGASIRSQEPVTEMVANRFPVSLTIALMATLLSLLIAIPAGVLAAYRRNSLWDYVLMGFSTIGLSVPTFTLALVLILFFALKLQWVPISGIGLRTLSDGFWPFVLPYIIPVVALAVTTIAELARIVRASMLEVLDQEYIRVARAQGLGDSVVLRVHALKNVFIPIITVIAIIFAFQVGNTITIEYLFSIPGVGSALINAVISRDFPVIQGLTLVVGIFFIGMNLLADILYAVVDPRIHYN